MTHLEEYLKHYSSLKAPGYAALVTGAWGTGKTFQVKECMPEESYIYVSLYGVQTVEQIHAEVFAAAHPEIAKTRGILDKFKGKDVGALGFTIPLGVVPDVANAILRNEVKPEKTLIFDDLERSGIKLGEVLGAINSYVEHKEFRVVVIAHDDEKLLGQDFRSIKEKTFGQTICIEPQVGRAFDRFSDEIKDGEAKKFVRAHRSAIEGVFRQSQEKSLRVLRHAIEDLVRLHDTLSEEHRKNSEAMAELVMSFTAFGVEFRSGNLEAKDLRNRRSVRMRYMMQVQGNAQNQPEAPPLVNADEKYPEIDLESGMLNDAVLVFMLVEGRFPKDEIRASIDNSPHFIVPGEVPPWKVVTHFDELDDETVEEARKRMEQQFENREVTDSGEMLHIFCLRMMMAEYGITEGKVEDVVVESKKYIDDLLENAELPPRGTDSWWFDDFDGAYDGFVYWGEERNAAAIKDIWNHLIACREKAFLETLPSVNADLLRLVAEDSKAFFEAVSPTNNGPNPYAMIPLLHEIPPKDFVDAWLGSERKNWRHVTYALEKRYSANQLQRNLAQEKGWALEVLQELSERSSLETGFKSLRIKRIEPKVLVELAKAESEAAAGAEVVPEGALG